MSDKNIVHVVGTGTIGEPLIGLSCDYRKELGIDEVTFSKRTPLLTDRSKVIDLVKKEEHIFVWKGKNGMHLKRCMKNSMLNLRMTMKRQ